MVAFETGDFWGVYALPVSVRRWMIQRHNKWLEKTSAKSSLSNDSPLSPAQKAKMRSQIQGIQSDPSLSMKAFTHGVK